MLPDSDSNKLCHTGPGASRPTAAVFLQRFHQRIKKKDGCQPPGEQPRVSRYIIYEDLASALEWLTEAFGFRERMRISGPDGKVNHAEMELSEGLLMMGCPGPEYQNPKRIGRVTQELSVYVDDVDDHFDRAQGARATILEEPADQFYGDRRYRAVDPEGHQWCFAQHVRDVAPEAMTPPA
jgi:uncharacterized glyoxalase superfamily protein PhnB